MEIFENQDIIIAENSIDHKELDIKDMELVINTEISQDQLKDKQIEFVDNENYTQNEIPNKTNENNRNDIQNIMK